MKKLCFIDVETTGLNHYKNAVIQIAGIIEIDNVVKESFEFKCKPFPNDEIADAALKVHGMTKEKIMEFPDPMITKRLFTMKLQSYVDNYNPRDKFHFIGYNAAFDSDFIRQWMWKCGDKFYGSYFWHPYIDVMQLAAMDQIDNRSDFTNFKLNTLCQHYGLEWDEAEAHDAMYDITKTRELFNKLINKPNNA